MPSTPTRPTSPRARNYARNCPYPVPFTGDAAAPSAAAVCSSWCVPRPADDSILIWDTRLALLGTSSGQDTTGRNDGQCIQGARTETPIRPHSIRPAGACPRHDAGRQIVCMARSQRSTESTCAGRRHTSQYEREAPYMPRCYRVAMTTPEGPVEEQVRNESESPEESTCDASIFGRARKAATNFRAFTGPMIVAILLPQLLGTVVALQVEGRNKHDMNSLDNAFELAVTPLAVLFALVLFLLEHNHRGNRDAGDEKSWQTRTSMALSMTGAWAALAIAAILVHIAGVPDWDRQHTAYIATWLTVVAFGSLLVVPVTRHLLGQPDPPTEATSRVGARIFDSIVTGLLVALIWMLFREDHESRFKFAQLTYFVSGVFIVWLYELVFTWRWRSLGKAVFGLRIVKARSHDRCEVTSDTPSWFQAAQRAIVVSIALTTAVAFFYGAVREKALPEMNFLAGWKLLFAFVGGMTIMISSAVHPGARGIYDLIAGTKVIKENKESSAASGPAATAESPRNQTDRIASR